MELLERIFPYILVGVFLLSIAIWLITRRHEVTLEHEPD